MRKPGSKPFEISKQVVAAAFENLMPNGECTTGLTWGEGS